MPSSKYTHVVFPVGHTYPMNSKNKKGKWRVACFKTRAAALRDIDTYAHGPRKKEFEVRRVLKSQVIKWQREWNDGKS